MPTEDIAALGLSVDSKQVERGSTALDKLSASAKAAEQAATRFEGAATKATAQTAHLAQETQKLSIVQQRINAVTGVRDGFASSERAADIAAYGSSLDSLRDKYAPLNAVERMRKQQIAEVNTALHTGILTNAEHAAAILRVDAAARNQSRAIALNEKAILQAGKGALVSGFQMQNLAFQINDVATMAAMGMDPLRILTSQAGQFYQVLAMTEGGPISALRDLGGRFMALLTPMRLLMAGGLGVAATLVAAATAASNMRNEITLALLGTGSAAGLTVDSIMRVAQATASLGNVSEGTAREMALAFTVSGRVGEEVLERALATGKNLAKMFGEEPVEAAQRLARALADPAKGVDELDRRLSAFDDTTAQHIKNLAAQGRFLEAQHLIIDRVTASTAQAASATTGWAQAWTAMRNAASDAWNTIATGAADTLGILTRQEELARLQSDRMELIKRLNRVSGPGMRAVRIGEIEEISRRIRQLRQEIISLDTEASSNRGARELGDMIRSIVPEDSTLQGLENTLSKLQRLAEMPGVLDKLSPSARASLERAVAIAQGRVDGFMTEMEAARVFYEMETRRIEARTPLQRAQITFEETLARLRRQGLSEEDALLQATYARNRVLIQSSEDVARAQEDSRLSAQQRTQSSALELSLVGQTTLEQERQRGLLQNRQQLEAEALRMYGDRNAFDRSHLAALNAETNAQVRNNQLAREKTLALELQFERQQAIRTEADQELFSRLRAAGLLDANGQIANAGGAALAQQIRLNQAMSLGLETTREFARTFLGDVAQGKSMVDALTNAVQRLGMRLLDLSIDRSLSSLFNIGPVGNLGAGAAARGGLFGGMLIPGILHDGGVAGSAAMPRRPVHASAFKSARRFHNGGMPGLASNEVPAILEKGEIVLPKGFGDRPAAGEPKQVIQVTNSYHFSPGMTPADMNMILAQIEQASRETEARTVQTIRQQHQTNSGFLFGQ